MELPNNIYDLSIQDARFPEVYERAKITLSECASIDECKEWADKAAALASYAKQANDDSLEQLSMRIRARAIRRAGELLKTFDGRPINAKKQSNGSDTLFPTQQQAAERVGMSKRQQVTAVRVANIDEKEFEEAIESEKPPTLTALAEKGRQYLMKPKPEGFAEATQVIGDLSDLAKSCERRNPKIIANAMEVHEVLEAQKNISVIEEWLEEFKSELIKMI